MANQKAVTRAGYANLNEKHCPTTKTCPLTNPPVDPTTFSSLRHVRRLSFDINIVQTEERGSP
jgi:hypothetical protein